MIIKGKLRWYLVTWRKYGWSGAVADVQVPETGWKRRIFGARRIWEGPFRGYVTAEKMHPKEMREWFRQAVNEYEDYLIAWGKAPGQ